MLPKEHIWSIVSPTKEIDASVAFDRENAAWTRVWVLTGPKKYAKINLTENSFVL
jgi:hypothetical protein